MSTPLIPLRSEWRDIADSYVVDAIDVTPRQNSYVDEASLWLGCGINDDLPYLRFSLEAPLERDYVDRNTSYTRVEWRVDSRPWGSTDRAEYRSSDYFSTVTYRRVYTYSARLDATGPTRQALNDLLTAMLDGSTLEAKFAFADFMDVPALTYTFPIVGTQEAYQDLACTS